MNMKGFRILIPVDFTDLSTFALEMAETLAMKNEVDVHLLHIVLAPGQAVFDQEGNLKDCNDFDVNVLKKEQEETQSQIDELKSKYSFVTTAISKIGHIADGILSYAERNDMQMVLMGIKGASGMRELTIGSLAERLVRKSPIPVLTLKCSRKGINLSDLVLAGDFSKGESVDLTTIKWIQRSFHSKIHLLQINTPNHFQSQREALRNMKGFADLNGMEQVDFHLWSDYSVEMGIRNFCLHNQVDFLAMGTHGRSGLSHIMKGSITEDIVNHIFQPVLSFHLK
jgi:nucleotide-binding universal stress UspA family protein